MFIDRKIYQNAYHNRRSLFSANNNWSKAMEFETRIQITMKHYVGILKGGVL